MKVSVIVTTKDEERNIGACLESIKKQSYPDIEMIVVDNCSSDKTKEIAGRFTKHVYDKGPERSAQRNYGVSKAKGEWIIYIDADMILTRDVISECVDRVRKDKKIIGLYIPERIIGKGFWIKVRDFERSFYSGTVVDCVRFIKKKAFEEVGGFDLSFTGAEDWDIDKKIRMNGKVGIIRNYIKHNEGKFDITKYLEKKKYYSKDFSKYIKKWGDDPDIKKQLGFYRVLGVFLENGKWKKLFANPILAIGMYYLRFRVFFAWKG